MRVACLALVALLCAWPAAAQTVAADRFRLTTGGCVLSSGSGSPEGVVAASICSMYINTANGVWYTKWTGAGSTGWGVGHNAAATVNGTLTVAGGDAIIGGNAVIGTNATVAGYLRSPTWVSQLTAWAIDAVGAADFRYLYTDELHAKLFIADLEQALAGGQIICKSVTLLGSNFTNPATGATATLTVKDLPSAENQAVFQSGDYVGLRTFARSSGSLTIGETFGVVTAYADQAAGVQTWTYTRGSGANGGGLDNPSGGTVIATEAIVVDYGVSGNGCHEVNAIDGANGLNSPYAQTWIWTTSPIAANRSIRTRLGNVRGITGVSNEYGTVLGNYGTANAGQYIRATSAVGVEMHNVDLTMYDSTVAVIKLDRTQPSFAIGNPAPTAYATGTGIWMGNDGGCYGFRVGIPTGAGLFWDCATSTLTVRGTGGSATNMVRNSECRVGTENWTLNDQSTGGTAVVLSFALTPWRLMDESNTCYVVAPGTHSGSSYVTGLRVPAQATKKYEASVYLGNQRTDSSQVYISWYNDAGAYIDSSTGANTCNPGAGSGGLKLAGYCRSGLVATAPANTASMEMTIQTAYNGTEMDSYTFFVRAFLGEATATQTLLSEWGPAGITAITGGMVETDAIIARHILADSITSAKILAGTIVASDIAANTITAGQIAASTITATQIAASTITADKLNVSSLSAITANIGTVTAGSISGTTFYAGGTDVTLDGTGLTLTAGSGGSNRVKWSNGAFISSLSGDLTITNIANILLHATGSGFVDIGGGVVKLWGATIVDSMIGGGARYVCVDNAGQLSAAASC